MPSPEPTPALLVDVDGTFAGLVVNLVIVAVVFDVGDRIRAVAREGTTR